MGACLALLLGLAGSALPAMEFSINNHSGQTWILKVAGDPGGAMAPGASPGMRELVLGASTLMTVEVEVGESGTHSFHLSRASGGTSYTVRVTHLGSGPLPSPAPSLEVLVDGEGKEPAVMPFFLDADRTLTIFEPDLLPESPFVQRAPASLPGMGCGVGAAPAPRSGPGAGQAWAEAPGAPGAVPDAARQFALEMERFYSEDLLERLRRYASPAALKAMSQPLSALAMTRTNAAGIYRWQLQLLAKLSPGQETSAEAIPRNQVLTHLVLTENFLRSLFEQEANLLLPALQSAFMDEMEAARERMRNLAPGGGRSLGQANPHLADMHYICQLLGGDWFKVASQTPWKRWRLAIGEKGLPDLDELKGMWPPAFYDRMVQTEELGRSLAEPARAPGTPVGAGKARPGDPANPPGIGLPSPEAGRAKAELDRLRSLADRRTQVERRLKIEAENRARKQKRAEEARRLAELKAMAQAEAEQEAERARLAREAQKRSKEEALRARREREARARQQLDQERALAQAEADRQAQLAREAHKRALKEARRLKKQQAAEPKLSWAEVASGVRPPAASAPQAGPPAAPAEPEPPLPPPPPGPLGEAELRAFRASADYQAKFQALLGDPAGFALWQDGLLAQAMERMGAGRIEPRPGPEAPSPRALTLEDYRRLRVDPRPDRRPDPPPSGGALERPGVRSWRPASFRAVKAPPWIRKR